MILVLLGTFKIEFARPLIAIEQAVKDKLLDDEIIVQSGHTNFKSEFLTIVPFINPIALDQFYDDAELIITHAGTGSILKGIKKNKKVIAVPRLFKLNEHIDDHQLDITSEFVKNNYILPWYENESLESVLKKLESFHPSPYKSTKENLVKSLIQYIEEL